MAVGLEEGVYGFGRVSESMAMVRMREREREEWGRVEGSRGEGWNGLICLVMRRYVASSVVAWRS